MVLLKYKDVCVDNITVGVPEKDNTATKGVRISRLGYDGGILSIQTPILEISENKVVTFNMAQNGQLFTLLDDICEHLIKTVYTKSKELFGGMPFSEQRIRKSLHRTVHVTDKLENDGIDPLMVYINNIKIADNVKVTNILNEIIDKGSVKFPLSGNCIININSITFSKKSILIDIEITHIKMKKIFKKKKVLDLESDNESETESKSVDIIEDSINEPYISLIIDDKNVDDIEFFDEEIK